MDLAKVDLIRNANTSDLTNSTFLESLIVTLGVNTESLIQQPDIVRQNGGSLLIWQYPTQFSKYLLLLQQQSISSYIEIGCRWGGTFVLTAEYLKRFNTIDKSVAVDSIDSQVVTYCAENKESSFLKMNSHSEEFKTYIKENKFDVIFINGDHSYHGVKTDYENTKGSGKIYVFHDIINDSCPGVVRFWNELKSSESDAYNFVEFTEQYDEVWDRMHQKFLGIGVAIKI